jgi:hypothetical protein
MVTDHLKAALKCNIFINNVFLTVFVLIHQRANREKSNDTGAGLLSLPLREQMMKGDLWDGNKGGY